MTSFHLLPDAAGWKLTSEGSRRTLDIFRSKEDGVSKCAAIITERDGGKGSLKIHRTDGTIEEARTYPRSEDPRETLG